MENSSWVDILNSCSVLVVPPQDFGSPEQFMDLSWHGQLGQESSLNYANFNHFDNRVQIIDNMFAGGGFFEEQADACTASLTNTNNISSQMTLEACEVLPRKRGSRTHSERVNHILAEKQRREEMNEKFSILRPFIPKPIKKDKASIVGENIKYVVETERTLKKLRASKAERQASAESAKQIKSGACDACQNLDMTHCEPKMSRAQWKSGPVEVQELPGLYAVIKITSKRKRGVTMKIHVALEECKVDVLQSNVTTVGDNVVQFTTIKMNPGVSADMNRIVDAIQQACTVP